MQVDFTSLDPNVLITYGDGHPIDLYMYMRGENKYIKLTNNDEQVSIVVQKFKDKGLKEVFMLTSEFEEFVKSVRNQLQEKIQKEKKNGNLEGQINVVANAREVFKKVIEQGDISKEHMELFNELALEVEEVIENTDVFDMYEKFKFSCTEEFIHGLMCGYIATAMAETFEWCSNAIVKNIVNASMLCDITLTEEDFQQMKSSMNTEKFSKKVIYHPIDVSVLLEKSSDQAIGPETLEIIRQHHERPNGKGYPSKINYQKISRLSAIYIVANYFTEKVFDASFREQHKMERIEYVIGQIKEKFYHGPFKNATLSLKNVFSVK